MLDVIGGSSSNNDVLYLLLQDPANLGRFVAPRAIASGRATYDLTIADINRDGAPDITIPGGGDEAQFLMQSEGQRGTFQPLTTLALPGRATQVSSGDPNGDGLVDLVFYATHELQHRYRLEWACCSRLRAASRRLHAAYRPGTAGRRKAPAI